MQMNLIVTLNSGYLKPLTVMLHSLERSNPNSVFTVYVAHHSLTAQDFAFLRARLDPARIRLKSRSARSCSGGVSGVSLCAIHSCAHSAASCAKARRII